MKAFKSIATLLLLLAIAGCATIMDGNKQELTFTSSPAGAKVLLDGKEVGTTPVTVTWKRGRKSIGVRFEKEGYEPQIATLDSKMNLWWLGNLITGGAFGTSTDAASGAMFEYAPQNYHTVLAPVQQSSADQLNQRVNLSRFVMTSYHQISQDLQSGDGDYLEALLATLRIDPAHRPQAIATLRSLHAQHSGISEFANAVIQELAGI